MNCFCVIEADFLHEAILRPIGQQIVSGDWHVGHEIPLIEGKVHWTEEKRLVAFKTISEHSSRLMFWGDRKLFTLWDGEPQRFDHRD
jgi:hypothetical protein